MGHWSLLLGREPVSPPQKERPEAGVSGHPPRGPASSGWAQLLWELSLPGLASQPLPRHGSGPRGAGGVALLPLVASGSTCLEVAPRPPHCLTPLFRCQRRGGFWLPLGWAPARRRLGVGKALRDGGAAQEEVDE